MFLLKKPDSERIAAFLARQRGRSYSYPRVGAYSQADVPTGAAPPGFIEIEHRVLLGAGSETFERGCQALRQWKQFQLGWVRIEPREPAWEAGTNVVVVAHAFGLWTMSACRIVKLIDEQTATARTFGFGYGTLEHAARGEEQFVIRWDLADDRVWYVLRSFSRPGNWVAWLGYPLFRQAQRGFAVDSCAAMLRAVQAS